MAAAIGDIVDRDERVPLVDGDIVTVLDPPPFVKI